MSVKLVHGLKEGKVVKVTDVGVGSGLACNCICLDCEVALIAINKVENSQRPHFRHYSYTSSKEIIACNASQETAIHYLAKEIIEKNKSIILPSYSVRVNKHNGNGTRTHSIKEKQFVKFDYVKNENSISTSQGFQDIKPDFIAYSGDRRLFIEIAVSHQADENKIERLKELNVSAIEIDLSKFDRTANEEELEKYINEKAPKKWLYHVKHEEYYQKALEKEQEKAKSAALYAEKEERERKVREEQQRKTETEELQIKFGIDFEKIILNRPYRLNRYYRGDLFSRVEQFIQSEYKQSINCYYRNGTPYVEHEIAELEDVIIYETDDNFQVECEFIGLTFNISIESQQSAHKFGYLVISSIYYQASKLLCNDLESKVLNQETEFERMAKEIEEQRKAWEEKSKQEALENEARQRIEEERRREARELQRKVNEKRKNDEETLVYKTIMKTYETKKKCEQWKKEHPVMPEEIIKQVKMDIPRFNTESFIDIRRRLQNKGKLIKVVENKLSTAVIVK